MDCARLGCSIVGFARDLAMHCSKLPHIPEIISFVFAQDLVASDSNTSAAATFAISLLLGNEISNGTTCNRGVMED